MTRWFRSEPMEYISLIVNEDAAHSCLGDLGKMGVIQFTDVSSIHLLRPLKHIVNIRLGRYQGKNVDFHLAARDVSVIVHRRRQEQKNEGASSVFAHSIKLYTLGVR